jgi:segregation and condensation protein B
MSLKAKLEAVIYAAEEPVTLAQLSALFADDAFEWKAQQEAASAEQAAEAAQPLPLVNGELADLGIKPAAGSIDTASAATEPTAEGTPPKANSEADPAESSAEGDAAAMAEEAAATAENAVTTEADAKRQARQRDREARAILRQLLDELMTSYATDDRGIEIREIAGGYRMATKPECHDAVQMFVKSLKPVLKLSLPALETLAIIAYKQPITAPEVNEIRGVDSSGVFGSLLARKLIATAGRKQVIGRPILYKTTREFLLRFGLKDVSELPSMEEFEKLAASELEEPEPAAEEDSEQKPTPALDSEFNGDSSEALEDTNAEPPEQEPEPKPAETAVSNEPSNTAEAAPAVPHPTEQAEIETSPHGEENK